MDPFVHLHVASGYSLQHGASHPQVLVERAIEQEMDILALTDRDGVYGAMKFVLACRSAGIRPVLGVDLAYHPTLRPPRGPARARNPVRGGDLRDPTWAGLPRVTLLATAGGPGGGRGGWAAICRLLSAVHLGGERGRPVATLDLLAPWLADGSVAVLLGPASEPGAALARRRDDLAGAALAPWREVAPSDALFVELVCHRLGRSGPGGTGDWGPGSTPHAARMAGLARRAGLGTVLTNAVRYADRLDAPVVDVLDAARRLVALGSASLRQTGPTTFRGNAEGFLKSGKQMHEIAEEICRAAGLEGLDGPHRLLARTRTLAERCVLDPREDLGVGEVHLPELARDPSLLGARDDERRLRSVGPGRSVSDGTGDASRNPVRGAGSDALLRARCEGAIGDRYGSGPRQRIWKRLDDELELIRGLGYASYFLTVADVTDLIRERGVRCAGRGSGAASLVNYLLGVSDIDPIRHNLLIERFLSPLRRSLPDIDIDVESARRTEIYEAILDKFGGERCVCVSMMDTYRVRHAVRDVGAALGMPPAEIDTIAKAFPHIRARDARVALRELPELRASGLDHRRLDLVFDLVERLDGLPRHIAMHPCGVLLSDATLLDRTPVEASFAGFPMSQFDKDDVEELGLLKLDVLGIRMQSSMAHAVDLIRRTTGREIDLDDQTQVPFEDPDTYRMISAAKTLGVFQIESPGQRELIGKSGIETFDDIITDISLFRPGPVKSDMITPYLEAKHGWKEPSYLHDDLRSILHDTHGVVVFHEQIIEIIAQFARVDRAEADERRHLLGSVRGMAEVKEWFLPRARSFGYSERVVEGIWRILEAFASFGFCKAHAAAFALPTFQSAWLKAHYPAHFLAGVLTYDPGMYPKRLILDVARQCGITVLGLDVNASDKTYLVEPLDLRRPISPQLPTVPDSGIPDGGGWGIRLALAEVKGINESEIDRIVAARTHGRPFASLTDFWHRAQVSRPIAERLVLAGGFDSLYAIDDTTPGMGRRGRITRRDLLLQVADLDRHARSLERAQGRGLRGRGLGEARLARGREQATRRANAAARRNSTDPQAREQEGPLERHPLAAQGVWARASSQAQDTRPPPAVDSVQLTLALGESPDETSPGRTAAGELVSGLPEMTPEERLRAELEILGLDVSRHVMDTYAPFLDALGASRSRDLLDRRSRADLLVAGVKVATQTPAVRSGRRVVFLTLDDGTGPVDATFFEDVQGPYAATIFGSWLLVVRGELRRTGRRGASLRATGAWELPELHALWRRHGTAAVHERLAMMVPQGHSGVGVEQAASGEATAPGHSRVLVHSNGFRMSPYADVRPAGESVKDVGRKLWHTSPGSPG